jgi:hypothetical protein
MEYVRSNKTIVSLEERQLMLYSNALKQFPRIKRKLEEYEIIKEYDLQDPRKFDGADRDFFRYSFKKLMDEASREWMATGTTKEEPSNNPKNWIKCSLCKTPNKYIFL